MELSNLSPSDYIEREDDVLESVYFQMMLLKEGDGLLWTCLFLRVALEGFSRGFFSIELDTWGFHYLGFLPPGIFWT